MLLHKIIFSCIEMDPESADTPPTTISCLPAELLAQVFGFLDGPAPSDLRLHDQPHADMLRAPDPHSQLLKNVSLVSHRWRVAVLPLLFRHAVWYFDRFDLMQADHLLRGSPSPSPSPAAAADDAIPLLSFIRANNLTSYVRTLTLVVQSTRTTGNRNGITNYPHDHPRDIGLYRRGDLSGQYGYSPEPLSPTPTLVPLYTGEWDLVFNEDSNWLWNLLLDALDPLRFTLVASPRMLAFLLARMLHLGDEWSFLQSHHILSMSRDHREKSTTTAPDDEDEKNSPSESPPAATNPLAQPRRRPCALFTLRPWTSLLLNEGSSTRVYSTHEYFHKRPPSLLGALLGAEPPPNDAPLVPATVRALGYVGIFPLSSHVATLVRHLPRVDRLFVQLVPRTEVPTRDYREAALLDLDDLWSERNTSYGKMILSLFDDSDAAGNWRHLQEFESGDAADRESWDMAVEYVEARRDFSDWRVERDGVFVKRRRQQQQQQQ